MDKESLMKFKGILILGVLILCIGCVEQTPKETAVTTITSTTIEGRSDYDEMKNLTDLYLSYRDAAVTQKDASICERIPENAVLIDGRVYPEEGHYMKGYEPNMRSICYRDVAIKTLNCSLCNNIPKNHTFFSWGILRGVIDKDGNYLQIDPHRGGYANHSIYNHCRQGCEKGGK